MALNIVTAFESLANDERAIQSVREVSLNKALYEETSNFFSIVPGIKGGQQVAAMKGIEYITKAAAGCGGPSLSPDMPAISQKWEPQLQEIKIKFCYDEFMGKFTQWGLANGYAIKDLAESDFMDFIQELIANAMALDMQRNVLFGDENLTAAELSDANKLPFYQTIKKGLIPTMEYFKTIADLQGNFIDLTNNAAATTSAQYAFAPTTAANIYKELVKAYNFDGNILLSNQLLYDNYEDYITLGAVGAGLQTSKDQVQNGIASLKVRGQEISPMKNFDRWRKTDFTVSDGNGDTVTLLPSFALFTRKEHLQVGVDDVNALSDLRLEYVGGSDEHFYIKANYMMDFKMVNPYEFKCAL